MSQDHDKVIQITKSSTRAIIDSFRAKTAILKEASGDVKQLIREGCNSRKALETARMLFGGEKASVLAIDGTEAQDQQLDMLIFYAGAFGYIAQLDFSEDGCTAGDPLECGESMNISAAVPIYEEDASQIAGEATEGGVEVASERIPLALMHFSEYYMAVKTLNEKPEVKIVLLDRTLAGDVWHFVWSVKDLLDRGSCVLLGVDTEHGRVSKFDLELARMLHPNPELKVPAPRSQLLKYAAIEKIMGEEEVSDYNELLKRLGADRGRLEKLENSVKSFDDEYLIFASERPLKLKPGTERYWERVLLATMNMARHIFETPEGEHPLIYSVGGKKRWVTSEDLNYMTLVLVYSLLRTAWEKKILVIGLIKDISAAELTKYLVPILQSAGKLKLKKGLPRFNSDKMLLQTNSVINARSVKAPWRTFEFDACFRTIVPDERAALQDGEARVKGSFKNVVSAERMFIKSYVQLWQSDSDPSVRSHVFSYDRPCYPGLDKAGELTLIHNDDGVNEKIVPMIHLEKDSDVSHLVMAILHSMALEVIPECLGHNYPLFLADKKAKSFLEIMRPAYLSSVALEMASSEFDQQVLFQSKFRDYRSELEQSRRAKKR